MENVYPYRCTSIFNLTRLHCCCPCVGTEPEKKFRTFRASIRSKSLQEWMGDRDRNFDVLCDVSESAMSQSVLCISLPSHGSLSEFPHNQPISFKIRLPFPLQMDVMWEVGLNSVTLFK